VPCLPGRIHIPRNRRFHAQTISCNDCGPYLIFNDLTGGSELTEKDAFHAAANIIESGGIIAVKGIGGYHFACSPFLEDTVLRLRELKGREAKPFAIMFESVDSIRKYCVVSEKEEELLKSKARPIVLLYLKKQLHGTFRLSGQHILRSFSALYSSAHAACQKLRTSDYDKRQYIRQAHNKGRFRMLSLKSPLLNGVLYNKRRIVRSVDDSVAKVVANSPS